MDETRKRWSVIAGLGTTQTLAWAPSYYLIAILAPAMARDTASSQTGVFAAFSASLLISAVLGPRLGAPARILQAGAPIAFGFLIERFGAHALLLSSLTYLLATVALLAVSVRSSGKGNKP